MVTFLILAKTIWHPVQPAKLDVQDAAREVSFLRFPI
jgi:hypothetical protein